MIGFPVGLMRDSYPFLQHRVAKRLLSQPVFYVYLPCVHTRFQEMPVGRINFSRQ